MKTVLAKQVLPENDMMEKMLPCCVADLFGYMLGVFHCSAVTKFVRKYLWRVNIVIKKKIKQENSCEAGYFMQ